MLVRDDVVRITEDVLRNLSIDIDTNFGKLEVSLKYNGKVISSSALDAYNIQSALDCSRNDYF